MFGQADQTAVTPTEIKLFKDTLKEGRLSNDVVAALGQPAYPFLSIFKIFLYFLRRVEALDRPTQEIVNRLVDARIKEVTAELEKTWNERLFNARIRGVRP